MSTTIKKHIPLYIITAGLVASCSIPKHTTVPKIAPPPESFNNAATDSSIASLPVSSFFKDQKLVNLINEVLNNNPDLKIAAGQIKIAESFLSMSKGAFLPAISTGVNGSGTRYGKHTIEGVGNFDTNLSPNIKESQKVNEKLTPSYWIGLNASWEIDLWGKLRNMKKAAQQRFLGSQQGQNLLSATLATQTAAIYFELVALDKEVVILNENIQLQEKALEVVIGQKEGGRATELAVQQFKAQLLNTRATVFAVQQQIKENENALLFLSGKYTGIIDRSSNLSATAVTSELNSGLPAQLLSNRPDVLQAHSELLATNADANAARAAFFPTLNISAFGAFNAFNSSFLFSGSSIAYQIFGGLTAPVFQQRQIRERFNIATQQQEIAFNGYQKTALNAYREVDNLLQYISNNKQHADLKKEEGEVLKTAVTTSNDLYIAGYANYLEIVAAQKSKLQADLELINAERNQLLAMIELYKALGGGWR